MDNIIITNGSWDYSVKGRWVGGKFQTPNQSSGYHGILKQWWESNLFDNCNILLISENNNVKLTFKNEYKTANFKTLDYYDNMGEDIDIKKNLCEEWKDFEKFDKIICQATFEHLYNPVVALKNLSNSLNKDGEIYIHTHVPGFEYHQYPRDYFRFYPDWFIDAENFIKNISLKELCIINFHIFALYKRTN